MPRPPEYDNLIKSGYVHPVQPTPDYIRQYLLVAPGYRADAKSVTHPASRSMLSYEGFYQGVQAALDFHGVRAADRPGHRIVAIQRVCVDLKLSPGQIKLG